MTLGTDWFAVLIGQDYVVLKYNVMAYCDLAGELSFRWSDLHRYLVNVGHTIPSFGYSIGRRHLSACACVEAKRKDIRA